MEDSRETRWLDAEEQQNWYAFAYALIRLPGTLDAQTQRDAGMSHFEFLVLSGLSMMPGRTQRMSDLARHSASTISRLSNVIIRLENRGWVRRTPDPADGRYTLATLTDDGRAKVMASTPAHVAELRRLVFDPLTKAQQRQLGQIAQRILSAIDPDVPHLQDAIPTPTPLGGFPLDEE
ncbi:DNA-binding MarR family transcriptional regulator [Kibdelosporangium banguiense]|uniref:DNA-binding MarR family transcriptional regulator n=1 Tax=Kibdelosporangium banguiense TaxID=1365924 RepID=A0ABS4TKN5_9PSEU|nr:MarR family winged helix-turn-helix transcriptional regulator [Kibdelosporangium banguiense]MBP2324443.1 DNA-binding MarR family transcriptional regulator [Kibdelosporangium banguiense]